MTELEYIKAFSKITVTSACKATNVNKGNLYYGTASKKSVSKVKDYIDNKYQELRDTYYKELSDGESENNAL